MKNVSLLLATCLIFASSACKSKTVVRKLETNSSVALKKLDGVPYRLPRTVISLVVPVKLVRMTPGPFVDFHPCFFPDMKAEEVTTKPSRAMTIGSPTIDSFGEPDPSQSYVVSIKGGLFENKSLFMEFSPRGVLKKGEASSEDKSLEFTLKSIQTATAIAGSISGTRSIEDSDDDREKALSCFSLVNTANQKAGDYRSLNLDSDFPAYVRARAAFEKLAELIRRRDVLISSPSDPSADSLKLRIAETDKSIESYRQLFLGLVSEDVWNATFAIRPSGSDIQFSKPLLAFIPNGVREDLESQDDHAGICLNLGLVKDDRIIPPPKFAAKGCDGPPDRKLRAVWIQVSRDVEDVDFLRKIQAVQSYVEGSGKSRGWYFRIPANADTLVKDGEIKLSDIVGNPFMNSASLNAAAKPIGSQSFPIAQLGVVTSIPSSGAGRSNQSTLELNGITGELVNFRYTSTASLDSERLNEVKASVENLANATDPLVRRKRELERLKTEKEIRDLNANLATQP